MDDIFSINYIIFILIIFAIVCAIGSLIGTLLLQFATQVFAQFKPTYGRAYGIIFLVSYVSWVGGYFIWSDIGGGDASNTSAYIITGVIGFLMGSVIFSKMLRHPETGPIGFVKGILISLFLTALFLTVAILRERFTTRLLEL